MSPLLDKKTKGLTDIGPLYHDFSFFGVSNKQLSDQFFQNQKAKGPLITAYIAYAKAKAVAKAVIVPRMLLAVC